jgi:hypothetical protein
MLAVHCIALTITLIVQAFSAGKVLSIDDAHKRAKVTQEQAAPRTVGEHLCADGDSGQVCGTVVISTANEAVIELDTEASGVSVAPAKAKAPPPKRAAAVKPKLEAKRAAPPAPPPPPLKPIPGVVNLVMPPTAVPTPPPKMELDRVVIEAVPVVKEAEKPLPPPRKEDLKPTTEIPRYVRAPTSTMVPQIVANAKRLPAPASQPTWHIAIGGGGGSNYFFPMLHVERRLSERLSLGITPLYTIGGTPAARVTAFGLLLTTTYRFAGDSAFSGFSVEGGAAFYTISRNNGATVPSDSASSFALPVLAGWRSPTTLPVTFSLRAGFQIATSLSGDPTKIDFSGVLPLVMIEVGHAF